VTKRDCFGYRRTDDIDPKWLADYAEKNPGVYLFGVTENADKLKRDLGSTEWQRMLSVWREHQRQQSKDERLFTAALKEFHKTCLDLNLVPHEVLQVLTAHLEASGGRSIALEVEAMRQVYARVYGSNSRRQSGPQPTLQAPSAEKIKG
jgi:hypothetical protein